MAAFETKPHDRIDLPAESQNQGDQNGPVAGQGGFGLVEHD